MGTKPHRGIENRFAFLTFAIWLAWSSNTRLHAQASYTSSPGKTSISAYYDPNAPAPAAKAPVVSITPDTQPFLPVVPMDLYLAQKAEIAKYSQSSFSAPSVVQISPVAPRAPTLPLQPPVVANPTFSWEGIPGPQIQPPSPDIAAGPSDVLMVVNSTIAQYTRSGTLKASTTFQNWFGAILPALCQVNCLIFDPWIVYDQLHGRFLFLAALTSANQQSRYFSYLLLSVSNGATYDSGWTTWALDATLDGSTKTLNWADSWRVGFDNAAIYLSGNMYDVSGNFQYAKIRVLKKSDVYNPATKTLPWQDIGSAAAKLRNADATQSLADSLMPIRQHGKPTAATVGLYVSATNYALPATYLSVWKINDPLAATLTLTQSTVSGLMSYNVPAPAPQLGGPATLDTSDTRLLKAIYRDGFLYTARDTGYTDQATTVTYDVIDTSAMKLSSQARLLNANAFYPAFEVPATTPLGTQFATGNLITGTTTAPDGTLTYAGLSNNLKPGLDYFDIDFGGVARWGDYFGGAIDPVSGGLWVSGEFAKPALPGRFGQWGTWAGYYPWLTTPVFADVPASSPFSDYINVLSLWQITTGCSPAISGPGIVVPTTPSFCPTALVTRDELATFVIRAMLGDNFTYSTTPYFTDVVSTSPFFPYIQKLRDLGLTHGCSPTAYCPGGTVSRMDAAVILVRGKLESLFGDNFTYPATAFFTDVPATLPQFPYIQKMDELGITSGCSQTQYCPNSLLTRQEMAVFVTRAFLN